MQREDMEKLIRVYVLDTLISQSGKQLLPELIGQLTSEIVERCIDVFNQLENKECAHCGSKDKAIVCIYCKEGDFFDA
jgi:hypothetical protein